LSNADCPEIFFATHNKHKSEEVGSMLAGVFTVKNLHDLELKDEIPETGLTLEENSRIKARYLNANFGVDCFADDTGLEVEALGGEPGVRSARYAGEPADDTKNIDLLLANLKGKSLRKARFRTVITLILGEEEKQFEGIVSGSIITERIGSNGFGYDPVFIPEGHRKTFAEMTSEEKNRISHRAIAVQELVSYLANIS
jgi:XTP/dITP diphosphohydrolase